MAFPLGSLSISTAVVVSFACGYFAGHRGAPAVSASVGGRNLGECASTSLPAQQEASSDCAFQDLLGLDKVSASTAVAALASGLPSQSRAFEPLTRHPGSKSILQDAFVRLHHLLFQHEPPFLPLHEWGARGVRNFSSFGTPGTLVHAAMQLSQSHTGHARPSVLSRLAHNSWILGQARRTPPNSTCLGWDNFEYINPDVMPGCRWRWKFIFESRSAHWRVDTKHRVVAGDISVAVLGTEAMFDVIVCNQVFEHVARPTLAIAAIVRMLRPRGFLYWSAPFNERFHMIPGDYFRYTVLGARQLIEDAGLKVAQIQTWGNSMITSGYMLGMGSGDFEPKYLEKHILGAASVGKEKHLQHKSRFLYMNVGVTARKMSSGRRSPREGRV